MMILNIKETRKPTIRNLLEVTKYNSQSTTGMNLCNILLGTDRDGAENLDPSVFEELLYFPQDEEDSWVVEAINQLLEQRDSGEMEKDVMTWMKILCTM